MIGEANAWSARRSDVRHFEPLFRWNHLPEPLARVSRIFAVAAQELLDVSEHDSPALVDALRKLWEAKNSAVVHNGFVKETVD